MLQFAVIAESESTKEEEVYFDGQTTAKLPRAMSMVNVSVRVLDVNDNAPVIVVGPASNRSGGDETGRFDVCADARPGDRLIRVAARDSDSGPNAQLHFALLEDVTASSSSSSSSYFAVSADDGWIVALRDLGELPVGQAFPVTVVMSDGGRPRLSASASFLLTVSDDACLATAALESHRRRAVASLATSAVAAVSIVVIILLLIVVLIAVVVIIRSVTFILPLLINVVQGRGTVMNR